MKRCNHLPPTPPAQASLAASAGQEGSASGLADSAPATVIVSGRLLFQIGVYRLSFDKWSEDERQREQPYFVADLDLRHDEVGARIWAQLMTRRKSWEYNEVVAWISVEGFHDVIKAHISPRDGQRMNRQPSQPFGYPTKLTEVWVSPTDTDEQITGRFREDLVAAVRSFPGLKRRHVDLRAYDRIAPYLNWHGALQGPRG